MASRARLVGQGVAIGLVALLFILLAWSLLTDEGGTLAAQANRGDRPAAPDFTLERLDDEGDLQLSSLPGQGGRRELLGVLVHPVQGGGAVPRGDLAREQGS